MGSLNKVLLIGNLGKDPELRYTPDGMAILKFSMATTEYSKDASGEKTERTTWHNITVFGKTAQNISNYLTKGKQVFIEGRINTYSYEDKETGEKRYRTEIIANNVTLLGKKGDSGEGDGEPYNEDRQEKKTYAAAGAGAPGNDGGRFEEDDIPFRSPRSLAA